MFFFKKKSLSCGIILLIISFLQVSAEEYSPSDNFLEKYFLPQNNLYQAFIVNNSPPKQIVQKVENTKLSDDEKFFLYYRLLRHFINKDNYQVAIELGQSLLDTKPDDFSYLSLRGYLLHNFGYFLSAQEDNLTAYKNGERNIILLFSFFQLYEEKKHIKNIKILGNRILKKDPNNVVFALNFIKNLVQHKEFMTAYIQIERLCCLDKQHFSHENRLELYRLEVETLIELKKYIQAYKRLKKIRTLLNDQTLFYKQWFFLQTRELSRQEKIQFYEQEIKQSPENIELYIPLISLYKANKQKEEYRKTLHTLHTLEPDNEQWQLLLTHYYWFDSVQYKKAIPFLLQLTENNFYDPFVYNALASYYNQQNRSYLAEDILLKGLKFFPNDLSLQHELILTLENRGEIEEALEGVNAILTQDNDSNNFLTGKKGYYLFQLQRYNEAIYYLKASLQNKEDISFRFILAETYERTQKIEEALKIYQQLHVLQPQNEIILIRKTYAEYNLQKYEHAFETINRLHSLPFQNTESIFLEALILKKLGNVSIAEETILQLVKKFPQNQIFSLELASLYLIKNQHQAKEILNNIIEFSPPHLYFIELFIAVHNKDSAYWQFDEETKNIYYNILQGKYHNYLQLQKALNGDDPNTVFLKLLWSFIEQQEITLELPCKTERLWHLFYCSQQQKELGNFQQALYYLQQAEKKEKENIWVIMELAYIYEKNLQFSLSIQYYNKILEYYPQSFWVKLRIAFNLDAQKDYSSSAMLYETLLQLDPENSLILNNLAWLYLTTDIQLPNKINIALKYAKKAVKISPTSAHLDTLAEAYYQNQQYSEAINLIDQALTINRDNIEHFKKQRKRFLQKLEK